MNLKEEVEECISTHFRTISVNIPGDNKEKLQEYQSG
jgi:hypothetical protein